MNKLKYLTLLLFVSLAACAGSPNHSDSEGEVIVLNKADFLTKVFDYEKNPSKWTYEGDKPCIIDIGIYKINVDKERELAGTFGVSSIPTILFVPMKGEPQVSMGALPEESFVKMIEEVLLEKKKQ